jgi:hypothetical protein
MRKRSAYRISGFRAEVEPCDTAYSRSFLPFFAGPRMMEEFADLQRCCLYRGKTTPLEPGSLSRRQFGTRGTEFFDTLKEALERDKHASLIGMTEPGRILANSRVEAFE